MEAQIQLAPDGEMVEVIRWLDGEPESWSVPVESVGTVLSLLQYDENGCLFASVGIAA